MSKAKPQSNNRRAARQTIKPFRVRNNRKNTRGRHTQYVPGGVIRHLIT